MSKSDGIKIGIKFTEEIVGDVRPIISEFETQGGDWTASGSYSSSYPVDNVRDESTSTYWQSRSTSNYIQIARPNTKLAGFRVYKGSSYRPSSYTLRTSGDGSSYTDVASGSLIAATGWEDVVFDEAIESDYFRLNFGYSSRLYLYELALIVTEYDNLHANDFIITGQEHQYVNGPLLDTRYLVTDYKKHPTEPKSILITMDWWEGKFNNVEGELTIAYDSTRSSIAGTGGAVESFEASFIPEDLEQTPNPCMVEHLDACPFEIDLVLKEVEYQNRYLEEHLEANPYEITLDFKNVNEINP